MLNNALSSNSKAWPAGNGRWQAVEHYFSSFGFHRQPTGYMDEYWGNAVVLILKKSNLNLLSLLEYKSKSFWNGFNDNKKQ